MILAQVTTTQPVTASAELLKHAADLVKFYGVTAAFILTLYALYTKDNELRQSHRELFRVLVLVLLAFLLQCLVWVMTDLFSYIGFGSLALSVLALLFYVGAALYFLGRVTVLSYLRVEKFKERPVLHSLKHLPGIRWLVRRITVWRGQHYETTVGKRHPISDYTVLRRIVGRDPELAEDRGISVLVTYSKVPTWLALLARLLREHLANKETVTLIACRHHPWHILSYVEKNAGLLQEDELNRLVIVDAFTPSFGGDDEVFHKFLKHKQDDGYTILPARSLAGIHSGSAQAFKIFKKKRKAQRQPGTVIYDGLMVYQHCEAEDHMVRFLTHMIEAERTYAMITVMAEPTVSPAPVAFGIASSLVDYVAELDAMGA